VRDFDAKFWQSLIDWRNALEDQFWSATSYGLPPHEERQILERIYREDVGMRRDLLAAERELRDLAAELALRQHELRQAAAPYEAVVRRYGSLLAALERRVRA
jgi:hypothetical protein